MDFKFTRKLVIKNQVVKYRILCILLVNCQFRIVGKVLKLGQSWAQQRGEIIYEEQMLGSQSRMECLI